MGDTETGVARKCAIALGNVKTGDSFAVASTVQGLRETVEPVPHTQAAEAFRKGAGVQGETWRTRHLPAQAGGVAA